MGKLSGAFKSITRKKGVVLAGAFALLVSGLFATVGQAAPSSEPAEQAVAPAAVGFMISSNYNNRCLTIAGNNPNPGGLVYMWDCNGSNAQRWYWDGSKLRSVHVNGLCLDVGGANPDNGASLNTWECYGGVAQQWYWNSNMLCNRISNRCLAIDNANRWNGATVHLWDAVGPDHQRWHVVA